MGVAAQKVNQNLPNLGGAPVDFCESHPPNIVTAKPAATHNAAFFKSFNNMKNLEIYSQFILI